MFFETGKQLDEETRKVFVCKNLHLR